MTKTKVQSEKFKREQPGSDPARKVHAWDQGSDPARQVHAWDQGSDPARQVHAWDQDRCCLVSKKVKRKPNTSSFDFRPLTSRP